MFYFFKTMVCMFLLLFFVVTPVVAATQQSNLTKVVINLPSRTLQLYYGNVVSKEYSVAVGKPSTPTPLGSFYLIDKERNPTWIPPGRDYVVLSGPDNPLGYRWMEFAPLYGIHGTNAPWTIGMVVSNGCVRMREEEAEELFELVARGTPITITYERIKIDIGKKGQASIGIYPDIYGYKRITMADVNNKLAESGFSGLVSEEFLLPILKEESGKQVEFAKVQNIKVNDTLLSEKAIVIGNATYLPIWAVATECKGSFIWDEENQLIWKDNTAYRGFIKGDIIYSKMEDIQKLFNLKQMYQENDYLEMNSN